MNITISLKGDAELIARFSSHSEGVQAALYQKTWEYVLRLEALIKQKLSGQVLNVGKNRPGHTGSQLRSSIASKVETLGKAVLGTVYSGGTPYAAIQEYGGRTSAHLIIAKRAQVLAYTKDGETRFARFVHHPGSTMPERSYMRTSLREMSDEISLGLKAAVVEVLRSKT